MGPVVPVGYMTTFHKLFINALGLQIKLYILIFSCFNSSEYARIRSNIGCCLVSVKTVTCYDRIVRTLYLLAPVICRIFFYDTYTSRMRLNPKRAY